MRSKRQKRSAWVRLIEGLESRQLLSISSLADLSTIVVDPAKHHRAATTTTLNLTIEGYTPAQIRAAYGFDQVMLSNGKSADGSGQTIAIVTAYKDPNILSDLQTFDAAMGLNDPVFAAVSQTGGSLRHVAADAGWAGETALDVEWAHAAAPGANILLIEASSASLTDLLAAVDYARNAANVSVVSMSWGADEFWSEASFDKYFTTPSGHQGVTFVAASGDGGSSWGPSWPSSSTNVLAVGGTTLSLDSSGAAVDETGWSGSGGGYSAVESVPSYQLAAQGSDARSAPDVSYDANPNTGFAVYNSIDDGSGQAGWEEVGGTSAGTPQWSGLIAVANQARARAGLGTLDGATGTLPMLYALYNDPTAYASSFNDVTAGRSSFFTRARTGYDTVTGLGSPKAAGIVEALTGGTPTSTTTDSTVSASRRARRPLSRTATRGIAQATEEPTAAMEVAATSGTDANAAAQAVDQTASNPVALATASSAGVFSDRPIQLTVIAGDWDRPSPVTWESSSVASAVADMPMHRVSPAPAPAVESPVPLKVMRGAFSLVASPLSTFSEATGLSPEDADALTDIRVGLVAGPPPGPTEHQAGSSTGAAVAIAATAGVYWFARRRAAVAGAGDESGTVDPLVFMLRHRPAGTAKSH